MKICVAQTRPIKGDIQGNIGQHQTFIVQAGADGAEVIIFPELSLTGYEPTLARQLAFNQADTRLAVFQHLSDAHQITIGVGLPTKNQAGICISMMLFQPDTPPRLYSKKYLHVDEEPFFVHGVNFPSLSLGQHKLGLAICYELSVLDHAEQAYQSGAEIYLASVAKSSDGVAKAHQRLADIARQYRIPVLMANCVGPADDFESTGNSAVWNDQGVLLGQLNAHDEGFIIFDTITQECLVETMASREP